MIKVGDRVRTADPLTFNAYGTLGNRRAGAAGIVNKAWSEYCDVRHGDGVVATYDADELTKLDDIPEPFGYDVRPFLRHAEGRSPIIVNISAGPLALGEVRIRSDRTVMGAIDHTISATGAQGHIDPRASLTVGPLTIYEDGEIRVAAGVKREEIGSLVLTAIKEGQERAVREEREACAKECDAEIASIKEMSRLNPRRTFDGTEFLKYAAQHIRERGTK